MANNDSNLDTTGNCLQAGRQDSIALETIRWPMVALPKHCRSPACLTIIANHQSGWRTLCLCVLASMSQQILRRLQVWPLSRHELSIIARALMTRNHDHLTLVAPRQKWRIPGCELHRLARHTRLLASTTRHGPDSRSHQFTLASHNARDYG